MQKTIGAFICKKAPTDQNIKFCVHLLHNICNKCNMARGKSGRIVIEADPKLKSDLYLALAKNDMTLKDWFLKQAEDFIKNNDQIKLFN